MAALSKHDPTRPIDWVTPRSLQTWMKRPAVNSEPLSEWKITPFHVAAAHGGGHDQRRRGEAGVVMLADREAGHAPAGQVEDRGEIELALLGGQSCQVAAALLVHGRGAEVPLHRVGHCLGGLVLADEGTEVTLGPRDLALAGMGAATVFSETAQPELTSSSCTRGEPQRPSEMAKALATALSSSSRCSWRGVGGRVVPLVEPALGHPEGTAGQGVRHPMVGSLGGDERRHAHRIASFTQRTTDPLRTSRSILSSAFSLSSWRTLSMSTAAGSAGSPRRCRSSLTSW